MTGADDNIEAAGKAGGMDKAANGGAGAADITDVAGGKSAMAGADKPSRRRDRRSS